MEIITDMSSTSKPSLNVTVCEFTIEASDWSSDSCTITFNSDNSDIYFLNSASSYISIASDSTTAQIEAFNDAQMYVSSMSINTITIVCRGEVPTVDIDLVLYYNTKLPVIETSVQGAYLPLSGGIITGTLAFRNSIINGNASNTLKTDINNYLCISLGEGLKIDNTVYITGGGLHIEDEEYTITLSRDPENDMEAVTKQYVVNYVADNDTKVTNTLDSSSTFYITGTTNSDTSTDTQVFNTSVYINATSGKLNATSAEFGSQYIDSDGILITDGGTIRIIDTDAEETITISNSSITTTGDTSISGTNWNINSEGVATFTNVNTEYINEDGILHGDYEWEINSSGEACFVSVSIYDESQNDFVDIKEYFSSSSSSGTISGNYLPLTGGTLTGDLTITKNYKLILTSIYNDDNLYINANNVFFTEYDSGTNGGGVYAEFGMNNTNTQYDGYLYINNIMNNSASGDRTWYINRSGNALLSGILTIGDYIVFSNDTNGNTISYSNDKIIFNSGIYANSNSDDNVKIYFEDPTTDGTTRTLNYTGAIKYIGATQDDGYYYALYIGDVADNSEAGIIYLNCTCKALYNLYLSEDPSSNMQAATKHYVDNYVAENDTKVTNTLTTSVSSIYYLTGTTSSTTNTGTQVFRTDIYSKNGAIYVGSDASNMAYLSPTSIYIGDSSGATVAGLYQGKIKCDNNGASTTISGDTITLSTDGETNTTVLDNDSVTTPSATINGKLSITYDNSTAYIYIDNSGNSDRLIIDGSAYTEGVEITTDMYFTTNNYYNKTYIWMWDGYAPTDDRHVATKSYVDNNSSMPYVTCSTAASTENKVVTIDNFEWSSSKAHQVVVKFTYGTSVASRLYVNSTYKYNIEIQSGDYDSFSANSVLVLLLIPGTSSTAVGTAYVVNA